MQKQTIINKLKFILAQDKKDETLNDMLYKKQLKILLGIDDNNSFKLLFNEESQIAKIIYKIVDIIFWLLKVQKKEREKIYNSKVIGIKDKDIYKLLIELNMLQNYDLDVNNNLVDLFTIVSDYIDKKKDNASLAEYIDLILLSLSFNSGLDSFLKYQIFSLIIQLFLSKYEIVLSYKYSENEINMTEDKSIGLIIDLLNKDENDFATMIQSIIVLNYNSLKNVIDNFSLEEILLGIADIAEILKNIKHVGKISVCVEKIIEMFVDEMESKRSSLKRRKAKNQKRKKAKKKEDITLKFQGEPQIIIILNLKIKIKTL
jgi:hypothetical protein